MARPGTTYGAIEDSLWVQNDNLWCNAQHTRASKKRAAAVVLVVVVVVDTAAAALCVTS
jgi:hypothetical protein